MDGRNAIGINHEKYIDEIDERETLVFISEILHGGGVGSARGIPFMRR